MSLSGRGRRGPCGSRLGLRWLFLRSVRVLSYDVAHREEDAEEQHHYKKCAEQLAVAQYEFLLIIGPGHDLSLIVQRLCISLECRVHGGKDIEGQREDNRGVLLSADFDQRLQVAKL